MKRVEKLKKMIVDLLTNVCYYERNKRLLAKRRIANKKEAIMFVEQAERMKDAPLSRIREIANHCAELEEQGKHIIKFTMGEPDFDTPQYIKDACIKAINDGKTKYAPINGIEPLRKAIVDKLKKENQVKYSLDEIMVTTGVAQGIFLSMMCFLNEGDEVILPNPGYNSYYTVPNVAGAITKKYSLTEENNFQIDIKELEGLITKKTKILVLINPNNPIGSILTEETLNKVADLVKEKTILMNGFSKYFAMTGWRLGYIAAPKQYIEPMIKMSFLMTAGGTTFVQYAAVEALRHDKNDCEKMRLEYKRRRDYLYKELNKIDKLSCLKPEGAFYIFLNIKKTGMSSDAFAQFLLEEAGVATIPGSVFEDQGEGFVRLSYATSYENIVEAVGKIKTAMSKLK